MATVYFRNPEGEIHEVDRESAAEAKKQGWQVLTPDEYKTFAEKKAYGGAVPTAIATGTRALAGVTGGLSDMAFKALGGDDYTEFQKKAEEASPIATTAGYIAGSLVPGAAIAKGVGKVVKGAGLVGTAIRGGLTNTAFGTSQLVDDMVMKRRDPMTTEHAATQLAHDFLIGATFDSALYGVGKVASKAWGKLFAKSKQADIGMSPQVETGLEDTIASKGGPAVGPSTPWHEGQFVGGKTIDPRTLTDEDIAMMAARSSAQGRKASAQAAGGEGTKNLRAGAASKEPKQVFEEVKLEAPQGLDKEGWLKKKGDEMLIKRLITTRRDAGYHDIAERPEQLVDFVRRKGVFKDAKAWDDWGSALDKAKSTSKSIGDEMNAVLAEAEKLAPARQFADDIEKRITAAVNEKYLGRPQAINAAKTQIQKVREFLSDPNVTWESIKKNRSDLRAAATGKQGQVLDNLSSDVVNHIQLELRNAYIEAINANAGKELGKRLKQANNDFELADVLETLLERHTPIPGQGSGLATAGDIVGAGLGGVVGGALGGGGVGLGAAVGAAARRGAAKFRRERPLLERQLLYKLGDSRMADLAGALRDRLKSAAANQHLGQLKPVVYRLISLSDDELMDEHAKLSVGVDGDEYMGALGLSHEESEEELEKLGEKASVAAEAKKVLDARRDKIAKAAGRFAGKKTEISTEIGVKEPPIEYAGGKTPGKYDIKAIAKKIRGMDPEQMLDVVMSKGWGAAPSEHLESVHKAIASMQFLKSKLPNETPGTALRPAVKASEAEWARFKRYYDVVVNPDSFLDLMNSKMVSREAQEAMETVHPEMLQEIRMATYIEAERGAPLPGDKRAVLKQVVGPAAVNLDNNQVQSIQLMLQSQAQGAQQQSRPPDGRQSVNAEKNMTTQGQRMEAR